MFTVYHSNQLDVLKSLVVELIRLNPLDNPFEQEQILVQSPGMSQWLKIELAKELGIAANLTFPLPATFIWDLFTQVLDDVPKRSAFHKEAMTWKIVTLLPELLKQEEFAPLQRYLENDENQLKCYQLAAKIADIFDQYLVFRPEWIQQWEAGEEVVELEGDHPWQPILWRALYDQTLALGHSPYHRANMFEHFIETLDNYLQTGTLPKGMPKRLFVVGITSLPPRYLDALAALGQHIDVHLMFTNPCRYYWGEIRDRKYLARLEARNRLQVKWLDDHSEHIGDTEQLKGSIEANFEDELHTSEVGNSLLASWGKLGRDNLCLLSEMEAQEIDAFVDVGNDNLLHSIQSDILNLEERSRDDVLDNSQHKQPISSDDRSILLHSCHSPMREVEVLHDQLLDMFANDPDLKPRDIIVMVADINVYSAAIQAVFGNAAFDRYIPFAISDQSAEQENPVLLAFMTLMALPENRCGLSELLTLLEVPAVMSRFKFNAEQFEIVKRWAEETGIRWGLDNSTSAQFDLPEHNQNSWLFGIQRMLLGYAMEQGAGLFEGMASYEQVQGMNAEIAGNLAQFIDQLLTYQIILGQPHTITKWRTTINQLMDDFLDVELEGELVVKSIRDQLQKLEENLEDAGFDAPISAPIINNYLKNNLSGGKASQRFLAGQVNFCTLMPMRSIPFDVVCLLGMTDGSYPRTMPVEGFDLMQKRMKPGDRSRRDDDRYLFLEALQSANKAFYLSYIGRSIRDNTEKAPSVLVSELLEYCQQGYCLEGDNELNPEASAKRLVKQLTIEHPLVPYSQQSFIGDNTSYASEWLPTAKLEGAAAPEFQTAPLVFAPETKELELTELQRFWRLPVAYFFNRGLKVFFESVESRVEDDEPFTIDGRTGYGMKSDLLEDLLAYDDPNHVSQISRDFYQQQKAQGKLPIGSFGEIAADKEVNTVKDLVAHIQPLTTLPLDDQEVRLRFTFPHGEMELQGWLKQRYQAGMLRYRGGKIRSHEILATWIDHLCLCAMGQQQLTHLFGTDAIYHFETIEKEKAYQELETILSLYISGNCAPLAYLPKAALAGLEAHVDKKGVWNDDEETHQKALKKMADEYNGTRYAGENSNDYVMRMWPEWNDDFGQAIFDNAQKVLRNALLHSEKEKL
ncbi:exodeoxyribonuclease V subunit gamma [Aliivibrio fischeri]|uniref:exodeoxyribonuclease V subunit gamma n=1 Tax=Aliivibrio fischeri TaxID=668 RepID=UPI0007C5D573|nr:exodeoxyribonuclease V subunit gamma [Aliivibrio fischeri]